MQSGQYVDDRQLAETAASIVAAHAPDEDAAKAARRQAIQAAIALRTADEALAAARRRAPSLSTAAPSTHHFCGRENGLEIPTRPMVSTAANMNSGAAAVDGNTAAKATKQDLIEEAVAAQKAIEAEGSARRHAQYLAFKEQQVSSYSGAPLGPSGFETPTGPTVSTAANWSSGAARNATEAEDDARRHAEYLAFMQQQVLSPSSAPVGTTNGFETPTRPRASTAAMDENAAVQAARQATIEEAVAARKAIKAEDAARRHAEYLAFKEQQVSSYPSAPLSTTNAFETPTRPTGAARTAVAAENAARRHAEYLAFTEEQSSPVRSGPAIADEAKAARQAMVQGAVAARKAIEAEAAAQRAAEYQKEKEKQTASR